jgi:hypothetical protein
MKSWPGNIATLETGIEAIDRMVGGLPMERITEVCFSDPYLVSRFLERLPNPHVLNAPSLQNVATALFGANPLLVINNVSDASGLNEKFPSILLNLAMWIARPGRQKALVVLSKEGTTPKSLKYFSHLRLVLSTEGVGLKLKYVKNAYDGRSSHSIVMDADFRTIEPWTEIPEPDETQ